MIEFDYSKLKGKIKELYDSQVNFSKYAGLSEKSISDKLNNKVFFTQGEIKIWSRLLKIERVQIGEYFFNEKLQSH